MALVNRLAGTTSPYLLQHAEQPVAWQPFDDEALRLAVELDRPLLISIGYAACHWCHVMAHESFDDPAVAEITNRAYVPIKVDREERPDLDALYMAATQAATGHGGWPMTVIATPDGRPFFAGTYFPPVERGGQPSFTRVLLALEDAWANQRPAVEAQADELARAVASEAELADRLALDLTVGDLDADLALDRLVGELGERHDAEHGGFSPAPKFPRPSYVLALLAHSRRNDDPLSLELAIHTLRAMAAGGIYDHLAGGFARYSVDARWRVPHFEKMLTDQALLASAYLQAHLATGEADFAQVARETLDWVLDELALPGGGLAASVDADAAGSEGSHAVFTPAEVAEALEGVEGALSPAEACARWQITQAGTFEGGSSVPALDPGAPLGRGPAEEAARLAMLAFRRLRPQPAIDDKLLTEWNAMAASALAEAAMVLGVERYREAAGAIVNLLDEHQRDEAGRLLRSSRGGRTAGLAMLGDHAWLAVALTRLFELDGDDAWLERARRVVADMVALFHDGPAGSGRGFFTTGGDAPVILARAKEVLDGALPSATAVAVSALTRVGTLTGDHGLLAVADATIVRSATLIEDHASAVPDLVLALGQLRAGVEVVVPGPPGELARVAALTYAPFSLRAVGVGRSPLLEGREVGHAYVCRAGACRLPVEDAGRLSAEIDAAVRRGGVR